MAPARETIPPSDSRELMMASCSPCAAMVQEAACPFGAAGCGRAVLVPRLP